MIEEERLNRIKVIEKKKHLMLAREQMVNELENLRNNFFVQSYFELSDKLQKFPKVTLDDIEKEIYSLGNTFSCEHDVCVLLYGEKILEDGGSEYLRDLDNLNGAHYFTYKCLECGKMIRVFVEWHDKFLEKHKVISISNSEYEEKRKKYFEFLLENPTEQAYQKLKKLV